MPDEVSADVDPRTVDDIINKMLAEANKQTLIDKNYDDLRKGMTPQGGIYRGRVRLPSYSDTGSVPLRTELGMMGQGNWQRYIDIMTNKYNPTPEEGYAKQRLPQDI